MGMLQCTRSIGDRDLHHYGVIATPEVLSLPRSDEQTFLVLATDGLWDVLSNEVRAHGGWL
jgi:protein phosphatase 2C